MTDPPHGWVEPCFEADRICGLNSIFSSQPSSALAELEFDYNCDGFTAVVTLVLLALATLLIISITSLIGR